MPKQLPKTDASAVNVADYIVERLAAEGIDHCFGVAGDYVFPICDAVDSSAKVKWIGCANELNASYAADGYARIRGAAMLATTYGVGELSAINGVMGANAERSLVFHVVGMPSYQHQRLHKIAITRSATASSPACDAGCIKTRSAFAALIHSCSCCL